MSLYAEAQVPAITSLDPVSGLVNDRITIAGTNLDTITGMSFGAVGGDINSILSYGGNNFSILIPNVSAGAVDVIITTPGGVSAAYSFTVLSSPITAPTITGINPQATEIDKFITISGVYLVSITAINFGTVAADLSTLTYLGNGGISVMVPFVSAVGSYSIAVVAYAGASPVFPFTISGLNIPQISSVIPQTVFSNERVTISGGNLSSVTGVLFGNSIADFSTFLVLDDSSFSIVVPSLPIGSNDAVVQSVRGVSTSFSLNVGFGAPTIGSVAPKTLTAGEKITITGTNFSGGMSVVFNAITTTGVRLISSAMLEVVAPNGGGKGFLTVISPYGSVIGTDTVNVTENPGSRPVITLTGIAEDMDNELSIYPNPARDKILIVNLSQPASYTFSDLAGQIWISGITGKEIDLKGIENGFYILKIDEGNKVSYKKVVIKKE